MEVDTCLCVSLSCGEFTARTERLEAVFENISQTNVVKYWTFKGVMGVFCSVFSVSRSCRPLAPRPIAAVSNYLSGINPRCRRTCSPWRRLAPSP